MRVELPEHFQNRGFTTRDADGKQRAIESAQNWMARTAAHADAVYQERLDEAFRSAADERDLKGARSIFEPGEFEYMDNFSVDMVIRGRTGAKTPTVSIVREDGIYFVSSAGHLSEGYATFLEAYLDVLSCQILPAIQ